MPKYSGKLANYWFIPEGSKYFAGAEEAVKTHGLSSPRAITIQQRKWAGREAII